MRLLQDFFGLSAKTRSMSLSSTSESINVHAIKRAYRRLSLTLDIADKQRPPELSAHLEGLDEAGESHTEETQFISIQARELLKVMRVRYMWGNEVEMLRRCFRHLKSPKPEPGLRKIFGVVCEGGSILQLAQIIDHDGAVARALTLC